MLAKMSAYRRDFDETKYMSFLTKNDELLEKYNEIWDKVSNTIKKGFDSEPLCNEKYLRSNINFYEGKISTNFYDDNIPKEGSQYIFLSVILIVSVFKLGKNLFLEECKYKYIVKYMLNIYVVKKKKMPKYIIDNIEISSDDSDKEDSDKEYSEEDSD